MAINGRWQALLKLALVLVPLAWGTTVTVQGWMLHEIVDLKTKVAFIEGQMASSAAVVATSISP